MEKAEILDVINQCVDACENLATASTHTSDRKLYRDCMTQAIDCADIGMMLIIKLNEEPDNLHRNLFKQFVKQCKECLTCCEMHFEPQAIRALESCKRCITLCNQYVNEHALTDQYYFMTNRLNKNLYARLSTSI